MIIEQIILDIFVITLLIITIVFCWRLNNKIIELQSSKKSLREVVKIFDIAVIKTHKSIADLRNISASSAEELRHSISRANDVLGDLTFINDTASKLADRIENDIDEMRKLQEFKNFVSYNRGDVNQKISNIGNRDNYINENQKIQPIKSTFTKAKDELLQTIKLVKNR